MRVRLARLAQHDVVGASGWYDEQRRGLGTRFVKAVDRVITRIGENPRQFPVVYATARRALVGRFPYGVYFQLADDYVRVVAIVHLKQEAHTWQRRL